jgi:hypothetical protein
MLESNFSKQVVVPFLDQPFPIEQQKREDQLFRSITFPSDTQTALRLHAINHNYKVVSTIEKRTINLHIPEDEWNPETDKLRIKAYLSIPVDGVRESHWVTQHHVDYGMAQSHNQYRVRGVSTQGYLSDWVYSEIRDDENDLILYELLYEIIDTLQVINDKDVTYLLDYALEDMFNTIFSSGKPLPSTSFALNDEIKTKINELLQVFSAIFTSSFKEDVFASPKEFTEIARTYKLLEKYQEAKTDFLALLIEHYLEEKYEELIKKVDLEVFLKNDEEMQVLLQSMYEFDIKNELIRSLYDIEPHDRFVTSLNDAVELISEPIVFEQLKTTPKETIEQFMRLAFQELYIPLLIMDKRAVELTHELFDESSFESKGDIVEIDTINGEDVYKLLLAYDVLELLMNDLVDPEMDFHIQFIEKIIQTANQEQLSLFIEYSPIEFIEWITNIKENFQTKYLSLMNLLSCQMNTQIKEDTQVKKSSLMSLLQYPINTQIKEDIGVKNSLSVYPLTHQVNIQMDADHKLNILKETTTLKDACMAKINEFHALKEKVKSPFYQMEFIVKTLESAFHQINTTNIESGYNLSLISEEDYFIQTNKERFHHELVQKILMNEHIINNLNKWFVFFKESLKSYPMELFSNTWNLNPSSLYNELCLEKKEIEIDQDLEDEFIMSGEEVVRYMLGEIGGDWPLGQFVLGINTLKGQSDVQTGEN